MDMPPMGADSGAMQEPAQDGGTKFCIKQSPDGALSYYTERNGQAEQEMPATSIGEAMKMLLDAFRDSGAGAERGGFDSVSEPAQPAMPQRNRQPYGAR